MASRPGPPSCSSPPQTTRRRSSRCPPFLSAITPTGSVPPPPCLGFNSLSAFPPRAQTYRAPLPHALSYHLSAPAKAASQPLCCSLLQASHASPAFPHLSDQ